MSLDSNISKYYWYEFLSRWTLFLPYIIFYFLEIGLSLTQIMIMTAVMSVTVAIAEIPTGYIADRIGRKNSMLISGVLMIVSTCILFTAESFIPLLMVYILLGLSDAFLSGADSAFLYDTLLSMKKEKDYKKIQGKAQFFAEIGVITASILGALLIVKGVKITIAISLIGYIAMFCIALTFKEPFVHRKIASNNIQEEIYSLFGIVKKSLQNRKLIKLFLYSLVILGTSMMLFEIYQPYFGEVNLPLPAYGIIFAVMSLFTAFAALYAHKWERKMGMRISLIMIPVFLTASILGAGFFYAWYGIAFFFLRELVRGFFYPVISDYTNRIAESKERATVLSVQSFFSRIGYAFVALIFGFFGDLIGIKSTLIWIGAAMALITLIFAVGFSQENEPDDTIIKASN